MLQQLPVVPGVCLLAVQTDKFKTGCFSVNFVRPHGKRDAALDALLPSVLLRGTQRYPDIRAISTHLDELYGATFGTLVRLKGEVKMTGFYADFIEDAFLPPGEGVFAPMLDFLEQVLYHPCLENGVFAADSVEGEKQNLINAIESSLNDKRTYAALRLRSLMCQGEAYAVPRLGCAEDVETITSQRLTQHWQEVLTGSRVELFYAGRRAPQEVAESFARVFAGHAPMRAAEVGTKPHPKPTRLRVITEEMDVTQGKLVIGYRTNTTYEDPDFPALLMMNGIFGGFTHSKLFQNVREKASLAYYASSSVEYIKGIMTVSAGIDCSNEERVLKIVAEQLDEIRAGNITQTEMDFTFKGLRSSLLMADDSVSGGVDFVLCDLVSGKTRTSKELIEQLSKVTPQDVVRVANRVQQDTVYFLSCADGVGGGCDEE